MRAWWESLAQRERRVLSVGLAVLVVVLFWIMIWEPLANQRSSLRNEVSRLSSELAWMQQVADQVRRQAAVQRSQGETGRSNGSVLTLVEVSANAAGVKPALERLQPEGQGARLWLEGVGFDALLVWLAELEQRHGLLVSQLAVDVGDEPGRVSARILLEPR
ncbi:type II secretion system protein GspM [Halopseudomonas phragmitis]|uniref:Type II secretion system protein M n=2 Tax=Pseudomonadaceae TaxID=135621 RepID=A0A1V0B5B8_9GAMM|nr:MULTISPECIES: type II secretion system protein M [Pseudomonadaceae]AQZ95091.1 hypothetical protein BVH74_10180 [Halopseudomonas phragmitis]RHW21931.1 type II secretion system protein M [Pseudomonas jilinensis]